MESKTIFITGAGSGIGKDVAFDLSRRGHRVIATTETHEQANALQGEASQKNILLTVYKLDTTLENDRKSIERYLDIDVLINNAAIGESGSLADIDMNVVRRSFEVNVFAALELTKLALKNIMKRGKGNIIFISSTAGRIVVPFLGPYAMTKFALSSGAEALRNEMHLLNKNIFISLVEPGAYHTGFNQRMVQSQLLRMNTESYFYPLREKITSRLETMFYLIEVQSTQSIVRAIVRAAESQHPRLRYVAPWWQGLGVRILRIMGK